MARPLASARLSPEVAASLFEALCADVEQMLWLDVLHADLSPCNILWSGHAYRIIDFPQSVDPRFNGNAQSFPQRDVENVGRSVPASPRFRTRARSRWRSGGRSRAGNVREGANERRRGIDARTADENARRHLRKRPARSGAGAAGGPGGNFGKPRRVKDARQSADLGSRRMAF
jgi:serine/threonine-protein kinase RIO1